MGAGRPGAYVLGLRMDQDWRGSVGRLGVVAVPAGAAAYVGSAMGGLDARIRRHLRPQKPLRWHIDWLTTSCSPVGAVAVPSDERIECLLAADLRRRGWLEGPRGFGSSDCRCRTHLLLGGDGSDLQGISDHLPRQWRDRAYLVLP